LRRIGLSRYHGESIGVRSVAGDDGELFEMPRGAGMDVKRRKADHLVPVQRQELEESAVES
jgi:hypothetical protein